MKKKLKGVCFGEILFDVFLEHKKIGGAPLNVASRLNSLGGEVAMISSVGNDANGKILVDYFNEHEFHGNMPINNLGYQKRSMFSHQREYRIKIDLNRSEPCRYLLDVGDLSDIAVITTPKEFNAQLELKLPDGSNA